MGVARDAPLAHTIIYTRETIERERLESSIGLRVREREARKPGISR